MKKMLTTSTLAGLDEILKNYSLVIADIDYTLIDYSDSVRIAQNAISKILGEKVANESWRIFNLILEGHRKLENEYWDDRREFNDTENDISKIESSTVSKYVLKYWSKEAYIILAARKYGVKLNRTKLEEARNVFWQEIANNSKLFKDAKSFLDAIKRLKLKLLLMTGSDCVLKINNDLSLFYDPKFSENYKRKRLKRLFPNYKIVIGDPIDKPDPSFFDKLFRQVETLGNFAKEKILVIGDSERNDLMIPKKLGYSTLLISRGL